MHIFVLSFPTWQLPTSLDSSASPQRPKADTIMFKQVDKMYNLSKREYVIYKALTYIPKPLW